MTLAERLESLRNDWGIVATEYERRAQRMEASDPERHRTLDLAGTLRDHIGALHDAIEAAKETT